MDRRIGFALVLVSAVAYGAIAIVARVASNGGISTITMMLLRFAICTAGIGAIWAVRRTPWPDRRSTWALLLCGAVLYVAQSYCFFTSLTLIDASLTSLLLYTYPGIVTIGAAVLFREQLTKPKLVALALAVAGLVLTIGPTKGGNPAGIAFALGAAAAYSTYILLTSRLTRGTPAIPSAALIVTGSLAGYAILAPIEGLRLPTTSAGWWGTVGVALLSILAICTLLAGMRRTGPVVASTLSVIEPAVTAGLAAVFFGERLSTIQIVGGVLILSATLVLARTAPENVEPPDGVGE